MAYLPGEVHLFHPGTPGMRARSISVSSWHRSKPTQSTRKPTGTDETCHSCLERTLKQKPAVRQTSSRDSKRLNRSHDEEHPCKLAVCVVKAVCIFQLGTSLSQLTNKKYREKMACNYTYTSRQRAALLIRSIAGTDRSPRVDSAMASSMYWRAIL